MYDMYPDWGPAKNQHHRDELLDQAMQVSLDLRDNGGERPDDN